MIGEVLQEYLVSLGVSIDKPGFEEMNRTIEKTGETVDRVTKGWATSFVKAGTIIGSAIAGVTAAVGGLMNAAANEDIEMQKFARRMLISTDAAWQMKKATDALGESVNDILLTPELLAGFKQLTSEGREMMLGGDFKQVAKDFRNLTFEFTRLKQEASYAMTWIGYYLMKYLQKPLADVQAKFKSFNDSFIKNISTWTEKIARAMVYIINIGKHFIDFIVDIGKALYKVWDSFPQGVKIAGAALAGLWAIINASPLGRMIMLVSTLLLLLDDYYGYMEGKEAAFGKYWDKLNNYIEIAKENFEEFKQAALPIWYSLVEWLNVAKDKALQFVESVKRLYNSLSGSGSVDAFLSEIKEIGLALYNLVHGVLAYAISYFGALWDALKDYGAGEQFAILIDNLTSLVVGLYRGIKAVVIWLGDFFNALANDETVKEFAEAIGELIAVFLELFNTIWDNFVLITKSLFGAFDDTKHAKNFHDALRGVVSMLTAMIKAVSTVIKALTRFFALMRDNTIFRKFWDGIGKAVSKFVEGVIIAIKHVSKLGEALFALVSGDFRKAARLAKEAIEMARKGERERREQSGRSTTTGRNTSRNEDKQESKSDNDSSDLKSQAWNEAQRIGKDLGTDPALIYAQWYHETSGFTSELSRENNNLGGLTQTQPNGEHNKQPDGGNYYMEFDSVRDYADYYKKTWGDVIAGATTPEEYAERLKNENYYGDSYNNYVAGMKSAMEQTPELGEYSTNTPYQPDQRQSNLAGQAVAANALAYDEGLQWMGNATDNPSIQCDSFTANIYHESGIEEIGGYSTDNSQGHIINDSHFKAANAFHYAGDGYNPESGDLVTWDWGEGRGHVGIYDAETNTVTTRDSSGGIQHHDWQEALQMWGNPYGYGSIREAEEWRKGNGGESYNYTNRAGEYYQPETSNFEDYQATQYDTGNLDTSRYAALRKAFEGLSVVVSNVAGGIIKNAEQQAGQQKEMEKPNAQQAPSRDQQNGKESNGNEKSPLSVFADIANMGKDAVVDLVQAVKQWKPGEEPKEEKTREIPEYNQVDAENDSLLVQQAKFDAQAKQRGEYYDLGSPFADIMEMGQSAKEELLARVREFGEVAPTTSTEETSEEPGKLDALQRVIANNAEKLGQFFDNVELPKLPKVEMPKLDIPQMPKLDIPKLELPKLPKVEMPSVIVNARDNIPEDILQGLRGNYQADYGNTTTNNHNVTVEMGGLNVSLNVEKAGATAEEIAAAVQTSSDDVLRKAANFTDKYIGMKSIIV